jgi:hypothetical protein
LIHFAFILLVFLSFIDINTACVNTQLNWTCPGGYLRVHDAKWLTGSGTVCTNPQSGTLPPFDVTTQMKNRCDNKASCGFILNDASLNASCEGKCAVLSYIYECVSKSLVLRIWVYYFLTSLTSNQ